MRFFFDVDGVLLNFERGFIQWLNDHLNLGLPEDYETSSWYFEDVLPEAECREAWQTFMGSDYAARLRPYLDPVQFNTLTLDRPVHLLTNFPARHMDLRVENLAELGIRYDSLHHCGFNSLTTPITPTKSELVRQLLQEGESGLFLDDHPENCLDVLNNCPKVEVWLMSRRFNEDFHHPQIRRTLGWGAMIDRLQFLSAGE